MPLNALSPEECAEWCRIQSPLVWQGMSSHGEAAQASEERVALQLYRAGESVRGHLSSWLRWAHSMGWSAFQYAAIPLRLPVFGAMVLIKK